MESLSRLVTESLVRHGFDRPIDYRRLHWSRWFRCESHHSLLSVPSKPGVFAIAEEVMDFGTPEVETSAVVPTKRVEAEPQRHSKRDGRQDGAVQRRDRETIIWLPFAVQVGTTVAMPALGQTRARGARVQGRRMLAQLHASLWSARRHAG